MDDFVARGALRRLSIDIANLTSQLAVLQAHVDYAQQIAGELNPDSWERHMGQDASGNAEVHLTLRDEQAEVMVRVLAALNSLG